jgi:hypothetical protein
MYLIFFKSNFVSIEKRFWNGYVWEICDRQSVKNSDLAIEEHL